MVFLLSQVWIVVQKKLSLPRERGISVDAAFFQRHIKRAEVTFFKGPKRDAGLFGRLLGQQVVRAGVAETDNGLDLVLADVVVQIAAERIIRVGIGGGMRHAFRIKHLVAGIEIEFVNGFTVLLMQPQGKLLKKIPDRTLQQQDMVGCGN